MASMCSTPKRRTPAERFSVYERSVLFELVKKRASVFACKRTDAISVSKRYEAWNSLYEEYNSHPNVIKRTVKQLRKCWLNEKARRKKECEEGLILETDPVEITIAEVDKPGITAASFLAAGGCARLELPVIAETTAEHCYASTLVHPNSVSGIPCSSLPNCGMLPQSAADDPGRGQRKEQDQENELLVLRVKEQQYRTEAAHLQLENLKLMYKREAELHALVIEEAKLKVLLLKQQLCEGKLS